MTKTSDTDPKTLAERTEAVLRDATDRQVRCMSDVVGEPGASGQPVRHDGRDYDCEIDWTREEFEA